MNDKAVAFAKQMWLRGSTLRKSCCAQKTRMLCSKHAN